MISKRTMWIIICVLSMMGLFTASYFYFLNLKLLPEDFSSPRTQVTIKKNEKRKDANFDMSQIVAVNENEIVMVQAQAALNPNDQILKGGIRIPKVDLALPIYQGIGGRHMWLGASTMKETQKMGEGNYVLLGHNVNNPSLLFSPLKQLKEADHDMIYLADAKTEYMYQIELIFLADKSEYHWIEEEESQDPILTLVTCYGGDGTPTRRIVRAKYIGRKPIEESVWF